MSNVERGFGSFLSLHHLINLSPSHKLKSIMSGFNGDLVREILLVYTKYFFDLTHRKKYLPNHSQNDKLSIGNKLIDDASSTYSHHHILTYLETKLYENHHTPETRKNRKKRNWPRRHMQYTSNLSLDDPQDALQIHTNASSLNQNQYNRYYIAYNACNDLYDQTDDVNVYAPFEKLNRLLISRILSFNMPLFSYLSL